VLGAKLGIVMEKEPIPSPFSILFVDEAVGIGLVDQITPLEVTGEPPSDVTFTVIPDVQDVRDTI
jgi:hypothetical protein